MMKFLPVIVFAIALLHGAAAMAGSPEKAPAAVQSDFNGFIAKFGAALKANDAVAVAGMTKLPFMGDAAVSDAAQFRAKIYKDSFSAKNRACLRHGPAVYARNEAHDDSYSVFCGDLIFTFTQGPDGFQLTDIDMND